MWPLPFKICIPVVIIMCLCTVYFGVKFQQYPDTMNSTCFIFYYYYDYHHHYYYCYYYFVKMHIVIMRSWLNTRMNIMCMCHCESLWVLVSLWTLTCLTWMIYILYIICSVPLVNISVLACQSKYYSDLISIFLIHFCGDLSKWFILSHNGCFKMIYSAS